MEIKVEQRKLYIENLPLKKINQRHNSGGKLMTPEQSKLYLDLLCICHDGQDKDDPKEFDDSFPIQVAKKRIEVFKLPIGFTPTGYVSMPIFTDVIGGIVVILIDCLTKYEGRKNIDARMIGNLYPGGFYKEETLDNYIDNYLKPKKVKWSEIY